MQLLAASMLSALQLWCENASDTVQKLQYRVKPAFLKLGIVTLLPYEARCGQKSNAGSNGWHGESGKVMLAPAVGLHATDLFRPCIVTAERFQCTIL